MLDTALELLKIIEDKGFSAYLVGGCVRDYFMGLELCDIDVASNATMYDLSDIDDFIFMKSSRYGSSVLIYKNIKFELTTFRKEGLYIDGRRPSYYENTNSLEIDALRRDFTINSIYMDKNKNIIDLYGGIDDIKNKIIRTIGNSDDKFYEDSLRMLRAIRFATTFNFALSDDVVTSIVKNRNRASIISYERRVRELDKIFVSDNREYGIKLLVDVGLDKVLELNNLSSIEPVDDIIGIWAQLKNEKYILTKSSKKIYKQINYILDNNIDVMNYKSLYKYGLYVCMIVCKIRCSCVEKLVEMYSKIPLESFDDLDITTDDIFNCVNIDDNKMIGIIYDEIVDMVLDDKINNKRDEIISYLKNKYNMLK